MFSTMSVATMPSPVLTTRSSSEADPSAVVTEEIVPRGVSARADQARLISGTVHVCGQLRSSR